MDPRPDLKTDYQKACDALHHLAGTGAERSTADGLTRGGDSAITRPLADIGNYVRHLEAVAERYHRSESQCRNSLVELRGEVFKLRDRLRSGESLYNRHLIDILSAVLINSNGGL